MTTSGGEAQFDAYAEDYEAALAEGLSVSGEGRDYFAHGRIAFLGRCLEGLGFVARRAMDFGCGTGDSVPLLRGLVGVEAAVGIDPSGRSIERARKVHLAAGIEFSVSDRFPPAADLDLVYTNGVFHHIPVSQRPATFTFLRDVLRPGGMLALWENNPWSPAARYVMSKIPFDRDAVMVWPRAARRLARAHGFRVVRTDYRFIFPASLRPLRPLEDLVNRVPLGAQYQILCTKS